MLLYAIGGMSAAGGLAGLMFYSAFTHQSAVDVVAGRGPAGDQALIPSEGETPPQEFGASITLAPSAGRPGEGSVQFVDGSSLTLTGIASVPCTDGDKCVWTKENRATFLIAYGGASATPGQTASVMIGEHAATGVRSGPYMIKLQALDANSATFTVTVER